MIATGILLWQGLIDQGYKIKLYLNNANGIEAGKTTIKFRSVVVGHVEKVNLTPDFKRIEVICQMDSGTDDLLRKDSVFWVVKPSIDSKRISGLDTLLSGSYIQIYRGNSEERSQSFEVLDKEPVINVAERLGLELLLNSKLRKRLEPGDLVKYRGFEVGLVTEAKLNPEDRSITYRLFIDEPYDKLVTNSSMFWINNGIDMGLGPDGLKIETENLVNVLTAGISFDDFGMSYERLARSGETFELHENASSARIDSLFYQPKYVIMIEDNLANIKPGSSVLFRGMKIGEVVDAPWFEEGDDNTADGSLIPVLFALEPDGEVNAQIKKIFVRELKENNLVAQMNTGLLTSGTGISIVKEKPDKAADDGNVLGDQIGFEGKANQGGQPGGDPQAHVLTYRGVVVIPYKRQRNIMDSLSSLADNLNAVDFKRISDKTADVLNSMTDLLASLSKTADGLSNSHAAEELVKTMQSFRKTMDSVRSLVNTFDAVSSIKNSVMEVLQGINKIIKDLIPAARGVGQNPNSIIFGDGKTDPEPVVRGRR